MNLEELMTKYYLDKCKVESYFHNYEPTYRRFFENIRYEVKSLLEIGLGVHHLPGSSRYRSGNCLRCWRDYFPNAQIYGTDIDEAHMESEDRITTFVGDQSNQDDMKRIMKSIGHSYIDIIIDDGSHIAEHQVKTFEYLMEYIRKDGGLYIIEDIAHPYQKSFKDLSIFSQETRERIVENFNMEFVDLTNEGSSDNFLAIFTRK